MAGRKTAQAEPAAMSRQDSGRKRWVKLTPRDHVLKQIEIHRELVESLRAQLEKEEQTLQGMKKARDFFQTKPKELAQGQTLFFVARQLVHITKPQPKLGNIAPTSY